MRPLGLRARRRGPRCFEEDRFCTIGYLRVGCGSRTISPMKLGHQPVAVCPEGSIPDPAEWSQDPQMRMNMPLLPLPVTNSGSPQVLANLSETPIGAYEPHWAIASKGLSRQCENSVGTFMCFAMWLVTPPKISCRMRPGHRLPSQAGQRLRQREKTVSRQALQLVLVDRWLAARPEGSAPFALA